MASYMEAKRPFSDADWEDTPAPVKHYILQLEQIMLQLTEKIDKLETRITELETKTKSNSRNSDKPPSSDNPFHKPKKDESKKKKTSVKEGRKKVTKDPRKNCNRPRKLNPFYLASVFAVARISPPTL